jgi:bifunctional non-homologous end joining protein LigD
VSARPDPRASAGDSRYGALTVVRIGDREVRLTHPERVVWPETGTTKQELIDYLLAIAPVLLPHLRGRATMLWRFPEGVDGPGWFQAQCRSRPPWVETHPIRGAKGDLLEYCVIEEAATLAWLANLGTIELHPHGWIVDRPGEPLAIVFDLDPGPPAGLREAARVAIEIRERLRADGFHPVAKTSGALGLHVAAGAAPGSSFDETKAYARRLADDLEGSASGSVIARSSRRERAGLVYVDWIQNDRNRQLVAPYSPRATPIPQVSTPLTWDEVEGAAAGHLGPLRPSFPEVIERVERLGDLWHLRSPDVSSPRVTVETGGSS